MGVFKKVLWVIGKSFRYCFSSIFVLALMNIIPGLIEIVVCIANRGVVNELVSSQAMGEASSMFVGFLLVYVVLRLVQKAWGFLDGLGYNYARLNTGLLFNKILMWKSSQTPQEMFYRSDFMEKYSFVKNSADKIGFFLYVMAKILFGNIWSVAEIIVLFALYEPGLILYAAVVGIITMLIESYIAKKQYELDKRQVKEQRFHDYYKGLLTDKESARELRVYGYRENIYQKWETIYDKLREERLELALKRTSLNNRNEVAALLYRAVAVAILIAGVYWRRYDTGTFVMLFGLVEACLSQMSSLAYKLGNGAYKEVKYLCDYYDFVTPISDDEIMALKNQEFPPEGKLPFGPFRELKVENVSYTYPGSDKKAVDKVSLSIKKGEIISILGYNGSGKTTLSKLLNGSLPAKEGTVLLNGVPVCESNKEEVFSYFGNAPQEFFKFSVPLRDFVGLGRIGRMGDQDALLDAYRKAGIDSFLGKYREGDTLLLGKKYDNRGVDLSGGEWQKLVIASAYMGEPEILLMDEPTAAIDPLKEMEMLENFRENLKGKTAILISHRIGFARLADRIVMMEDGRIQEDGTHEELLKREGYYARIFREQKNLYEEEDNEGQEQERQK